MIPGIPIGPGRRHSTGVGILVSVEAVQRHESAAICITHGVNLPRCGRKT